MKKSKKLLSLVVVFALIVSCFLPINAEAKKAIKLSVKNQSVEIGKTVTIKISNAKKVKWSTYSDDFKIVKKTNKYCTIKGLKEGCGYLTARADGKSYNCWITVTERSYSEFVKKFNLEGQELCDKDGIKVILDSVERETKSVKVNFIAENNTNEMYNITCHEYAVNSLMFGDDMYGYSGVDVPAGKKGRFSISLEYKLLHKYSISKIKTLELLFWGYADSYNQWETQKIVLKTDLYDNELFYPNKKIVFSDNNIDLYLMSDDNNNYTFCMYNKRSDYISWEIENCSVDGWSYDLGSAEYDLYNEPCLNGVYTIFTIPIESTFLNENKIKKVTNLEFCIEFGYEDATDKIVVNF